MTIEQLRKFLSKRGMTQRELADALKVSVEHMSRMMHGNKDLPPAIVGRFVMAFGPDAMADVLTTSDDAIAQPCPELAE